MRRAGHAGSHAGILTRGVRALGRYFNDIASADDNDNDLIGGGRFPRIPGKEGYATVSLGDGMEAVPTAAACVRILQDSAAGLSRGVVSAGMYGQPRPDHWGDMLMNNPNRMMTGTQFWRWVFGQIYARGECIVYIERNAMGQPVGLLPARLNSGGYAPYVYAANRYGPDQKLWVTLPTGNGFASGASEVIPVMASDVLHLTDESYDPFLGRARNPLECKARNPIGIYKLVIGRYLALQVNSGHADRYAEFDDEGYNHYLAAKKNRDQGINNASDILPIPMGSKIHEAGRSAVEMQTQEILSWLDPRICMGWGVPLFALGIEQQGGRGVRQDLREQYQQFIRSGFATQLKLVEEEITRKVFAEARGVRARFHVDDLTIGTIEQRANTVNVLVQRTGVMTPNEGRAMLGIAPLDDPMADELRAATGAPAPPNATSTGAGAGAGSMPPAPGEDEDEAPEDSGRRARQELERMFGSDWDAMDFSSPVALATLKAELADFAAQSVH